MLPRALIIGALILSVSCKSEGGDSIGSAITGSAGSAAKPGSGGGFSTDLVRELGPGSAAKADGSAGARTGSDTPKVGSGAPKAGSNAVAMTGSEPSKAGSAAPKPGSDAVAITGSAGRPDPTPKAGSAAPKAGTGAVAMTGSAAVAMTGSAARPDPTPKPDREVPKAGSNVAAMVGSAGNPDPAPQKTANPAAGTGSAPEAHGPVKVPAELAAIKLSLLPNWDRDVEVAGTFQYVVRIKGTQSTKTFAFRYGYDDPKAPTDRDQYKKYLQDSKVLMGEIKDRQRGAAWFLEGTDPSGQPAFRYVVLYGGKRLICYGSLYRDADSSRLGDDRDQTVIQAKQICETLAL